jgi:hypothetical protein
VESAEQLSDILTMLSILDHGLQTDLCTVQSVRVQSDITKDMQSMLQIVTSHSLSHNHSPSLHSQLRAAQKELYSAPNVARNLVTTIISAQAAEQKDKKKNGGKIHRFYYFTLK